KADTVVDDFDHQVMPIFGADRQADLLRPRMPADVIDCLLDEAVELNLLGGRKLQPPITLRLRIPNAPFPWTTLLLTSLLTVAVVAAAWAYRQHRRTARANRELEETNEELRETRIRLARETESERSRIARDLHDQTLGDLRHLLVLTDQLNAPAADGVTPTHMPAMLRREIE